MGPRIRTIVYVAALCLAASSGQRPGAAQGYDHFLVGNPGDVVGATDGLLVLHGGGTDIDDLFALRLLSSNHRSAGGVCAEDAADVPRRRRLPYRPGGTFDIDDWAGTGGTAYTLSAEAGVLTSSRGEIY